jgi:hypothetical protein
MSNEEQNMGVGEDASSNPMMQGMEGLADLAIRRLREFLEDDVSSKPARDRARLALSTVNSAIALKRALMTQQRSEISIARLLSEGDMDLFQRYVQQTMPSFPTMRQLPEPESRPVSSQDEREQQAQPRPSHPSN